MAIFFRGLAAILPISGTIYLIYLLFISIENVGNKTLSGLFGPKASIPGLGILLTFFVIYVTGLMLGLVPFQKLLSKIQAPFRNIPLIKSIYSALEDLLQFFDKSKDKDQGRVVRVSMGKESNFSLMGLLTSTNPHVGSGATNQVFAVYIPVSYQIGGYTIFVSPEQVEYVDMSVEDLMKSALTAWIKK